MNADDDNAKLARMVAINFMVMILSYLALHMIFPLKIVIDENGLDWRRPPFIDLQDPHMRKSQYHGMRYLPFRLLSSICPLFFIHTTMYIIHDAMYAMTDTLDTHNVLQTLY